MAQCGGITNEELNKLEMEMCERMRWGLTVEPDELITLTSQLCDPSSPLWAQWGTEACERRWRNHRQVPELHSDSSGSITPPSLEPSSSGSSPRPGHQRSLSLGRMLGRQSQAAPGAEGSAAESAAGKDGRSPDQAATTRSPSSVLNRTLSFGGFLGSFSALVSLGS